MLPEAPPSERYSTYKARLSNHKYWQLIRLAAHQDESTTAILDEIVSTEIRARERREAIERELLASRIRIAILDHNIAQLDLQRCKLVVERRRTDIVRIQERLRREVVEYEESYPKDMQWLALFALERQIKQWVSLGIDSGDRDEKEVSDMLNMLNLEMEYTHRIQPAFHGDFAWIPGALSKALRQIRNITCWAVNGRIYVKNSQLYIAELLEYQRMIGAPGVGAVDTESDVMENSDDEDIS